MSGNRSRQAASFLVRLWVEDREPAIESEGAASRRSAGRGAQLEARLGDEADAPAGEVVRGFVRNLKTGEERYVSSSDQLARSLFQDVARDAEEELPELPEVERASG